MLTIYLGKTMVSWKMLSKIRIPGLVPRLPPHTLTNHVISPLGFFICYIRKSDMIFKTLFFKFCSSLIFFFFWRLHPSCLQSHWFCMAVLKIHKILAVHFFFSLEKQLINISRCLIICLENWYIFVLMFLN